jgi:hypothetical protein
MRYIFLIEFIEAIVFIWVAVNMIHLFLNMNDKTLKSKFFWLSNKLRWRK